MYHPKNDPVGAASESRRDTPNIDIPWNAMSDAELIAIVEVDRANRVQCQAPGCGHGVYRRIHVVRNGGALGVYGSDCFGRLFAHLEKEAPRYGGGTGRELTPEERRMLVENTARLIELFEAEHQLALEEARRREEQQRKEQQRLEDEARAQQRAAAELAATQRDLFDQKERALLQTLNVIPQRRGPPTPQELASVEVQAKDIVRAKFNVDPNAPGWRGLVVAEAWKLLGR